ncbi:MAG: pantetheine-phosphate adenylyltransferase [Armatimonadota bacterium]|nr:pantetheine-phosphate adenylyltransferase [Armatimonadota bacterium]MDR7587451.1 pantetheine-phosphate adenylyltransferase [Armatimonadota bacterium]MDR7610966.1 pantetheine-phosphate adenylyltransferase [Armatimonadota bacterium]
MTVAVYPGSFDPVHNGHLDVIARAARVFDQVVVAVAHSADKAPLFPVAERVEMLRAATAHLPNVRVDSFEGLTVAFARTVGAHVLVKGLRAVVDFEYELKQAAMNQRLAPELDTVFFMTAPPYYFLSSTLIREVARLGGAVSGLVPPAVEDRLRARFGRRGSGEGLLKEPGG